MNQTDLNQEASRLNQATVDELRQRYAEVFGEPSPNTRNRAWLVRRILWRWQALAEGGLSERARQRAILLAREADLRLTPPKPRSPKPLPLEPSKRPNPQLPPPGSMLRRTYKGRALQVRILQDGFEFEGAVFPSLSAVAKAITGTHCSGFLFFRLAPKTGGAR